MIFIGYYYKYAQPSEYRLSYDLEYLLVLFIYELLVSLNLGGRDIRRILEKHQKTPPQNYVLSMISWGPSMFQTTINNVFSGPQQRDETLEKRRMGERMDKKSIFQKIMFLQNRLTKNYCYD